MEVLLFTIDFKLKLFSSPDEVLIAKDANSRYRNIKFVSHSHKFYKYIYGGDNFQVTPFSAQTNTKSLFYGGEIYIDLNSKTGFETAYFT